MKSLKRFFRGVFPVMIILMMAVMPDSVMSQPAPPTARVFVDPADSEATTCAQHQIAIRVEDVVNLTAFDLQVIFDPTVVEITNVENGGFLVEPDEPGLYSPDNNDGDWNTDGFISFGLTQQRNSVTGQMNPKSGSGDLVIITLQALVPNATTGITIEKDESMLVDWPDAFEIAFNVDNGSVDTASCPPTGIDLSKFSVPENEPAGTEVGRFATTDPDPVDSFTYTLVNTTSYPDNASFKIIGDRLVSLESFNYEGKSSYEIRVRSTDFGGLWIEDTFTIRIEDVNDRPAAHDQSVVTTEDEPVDITLTGYDEDGDPLSFSVTDPPEFGTLSGVSPNLTYTPDEGYVGPDSFKFTASDADLTSEEATVSIDIGSKFIIKYIFPIFAYSD